MKIHIRENAMIITIDGPAAAGKGTVSGIIAKKYGYAYFDTGMLYRAVGLAIVLRGHKPEDKDAAIQISAGLDFPTMIKLSAHPDFRSNVGSMAASVVSQYPKVRENLLALQRKFSKNPKFADGTAANGVVYDGRDTGTVVFPNADLKFFITADLRERAMRRYNEYIEKDKNITFEEVFEAMKQRDEKDINRTAAPLRPAADAVIIDTTEMGINEVVSIISSMIENR